MPDSSDLSFQTKVTLTLGGVLVALAIEGAIKLYKQLTAPAPAAPQSEKASGDATEKPSAAAAAVKAVVTVQYCGG